MVRRRVGVVWRWLAHNQFLAALILIGGFVVAAFWRDQYLASRDRELVQCVAEWGDRVTTRSAALTAAGNLRADALDTVLRNVFDQISTGRSDPTQFHQRLADYVAASDTYRQRVLENPVPDPPRIRC